MFSYLPLSATPDGRILPTLLLNSRVVPEAPAHGAIPRTRADLAFWTRAIQTTTLTVTKPTRFGGVHGQDRVAISREFSGSTSSTFVVTTCLLILLCAPQCPCVLFSRTQRACSRTRTDAELVAKEPIEDPVLCQVEFLSTSYFATASRGGEVGGASTVARPSAWPIHCAKAFDAPPPLPLHLLPSSALDSLACDKAGSEFGTSLQSSTPSCLHVTLAARYDKRGTLKTLEKECVFVRDVHAPQEESCSCFACGHTVMSLSAGTRNRPISGTTSKTYMRHATLNPGTNLHPRIRGILPSLLLVQAM